MLDEAIAYPRGGDRALRTLAIGGSMPVVAGGVLLLSGLGASRSPLALIVAPFALVPVIVLYGYYMRVLRRVLSGRGEPPTFGDVRSLLRDGSKALAIDALYLAPAFGLLVAIAALVSAGDVVAGRSLDPSSISPSAIGLAVLVPIYGGLYAYFQPIAWVNFVRRDRLGAAFHVRTIGRVGATREYAVAWIVALLVLSVGGSVATSLSVVLIGFVAGFYLRIVTYYLYALGCRRALSEDRPAGAARSDSAVDLDTSPSPPTVVCRGDDSDSSDASGEPVVAASRPNDP